VDIIKHSGGREVLIAVRGEGEVMGEIGLLLDERRSAGVRARSDVVLISVTKDRLQQLMADSAPATQAVFSVLLDRWRTTEAKLRQNERMAQLGTLAAGLAHELNNPAAAVRRGAGELEASLRTRDAARLAVGASGADDTEIAALEAAVKSLDPAATAGLSHLDRSDLEVEIEDRLQELGVDRPWKLAPTLVSMGIGRAELGRLSAAVPEGALGSSLELVAAEHDLLALFHEVAEGANRISDLVGALKSYTYLDQAPLQPVDIIKGIEDTLTVLNQPSPGITLVRDFALDLPIVEAHGSELNQVWTNLIDNAAYAIRQSDEAGGTITLRAFTTEDDKLVVEVEDDGGGIPEEIRNRVFDAFFTTKPPGSGAGLGLDISYGIVVNRHRGDLTVTCDEGTTTFRVELPIAALAAPE
jgi:signal transduction histidine kinase